MASKIPGFHGQLLDIDLTAGTVKTVDLDPALQKDYFGARAMGGKMLLDAYGTNWGKVDALSPEAIMLFLSGPFVNFLGCKLNTVVKSPQSGGIVASQGSGDFIHEVRFSGYDGIILRGKAPKPVYITIFDNKVELRDASKIWGKEIKDTHEFIVEEHGDRTSQVYIGPAGENLVRYAAVLTEWYRAAARGGPGAVMGSKNVKALVARGTGPAPQVADQKKLIELMATQRKTAPLTRRGSIEFGTTGGVFTTGNQRSSEPVRNWQSEWHDQDSVRVEMFAANQWVRRYWADYGCVVACSKLGRVKYGKRAGFITELPDYESGALEGTNFGIFDIDEMAVTTNRPDELGFDLISVGNVCSWACEAQEKGILTAADLGGVQLKWGDADAFCKLMDLIAYRKGEIPTLLGEGLEIATRKIGKGSEKFAMHSKGIEWGAHGARSGKDANDLSYSVQSQGGDHMSTASPAGERAIWGDTMGMCSFQGLNQDQSSEWLRAITGQTVAPADVTNVYTPKWMTMMRISLLMGGRTYKDDTNPPRAYEPLPEGPFKGGKVDKAYEQKRIQEYYATFGWDKEGVPTAETLQKHGFQAFESAMAPLRAKA
jgi:aldehyde:ferredoxin oxidoreductase